MVVVSGKETSQASTLATDGTISVVGMNYAKPGDKNNYCAGVCTATTALKGKEGNRRFGLISFSRQIGVDPGRSRLDCSVSHSKALISEFRAFKNHKEQRTGYPTHSWLQSGPARTNRILLTVGKPQIFGRSISEAWQREDGSWGSCTFFLPYMINICNSCRLLIAHQLLQAIV